VERGFSALALHGDFEQREREQTLIRFASKAASILVATDVAARGLDIDALDLVINAELAHDTETHVHRIGRTGRAAASGLALSLVGPGDDYKLALLADIYPEAQQLLELPAVSNAQPAVPLMACLLVDGGKKQKLRAGDIVGALTANGAMTKDQIGKISVLENVAYIAVSRSVWRLAQQQISAGVKGKSFRSRLLG
jgi:ATP-independent RNA helicase DbpA